MENVSRECLNYIYGRLKTVKESNKSLFNKIVQKLNKGDYVIFQRLIEPRIMYLSSLITSGEFDYDDAFKILQAYFEKKKQEGFTLKYQGKSISLKELAKIEICFWGDSEEEELDNELCVYFENSNGDIEYMAKQKLVSDYSGSFYYIVNENDLSPYVFLDEIEALGYVLMEDIYKVCGLSCVTLKDLSLMYNPEISYNWVDTIAHNCEGDDVGCSISLESYARLGELEKFCPSLIDGSWSKPKKVDRALTESLKMLPYRVDGTLDEDASCVLKVCMMKNEPTIMFYKDGSWVDYSEVTDLGVDEVEFIIKEILHELRGLTLEEVYFVNNNIFTKSLAVARKSTKVVGEYVVTIY